MRCSWIDCSWDDSFCFSRQYAASSPMYTVLLFGSVKA